MKSILDQIGEQFRLPLENPVLVFALILLIILLAPILLRKLKVPGIIGLIIAGVIVGPHGLNLLAKNSAVDLFSTIGLLYIMFIAGLELDMSEFRKSRNRSLGFGAFTFIIPLVLGFPACYYILGYGFTASLLTASMFSTHTMVAYPIVTKFGISKNQAVAITVGGTILTDTAVLLLLAVITGSHNGELPSGFWIRIVISMAVLLFIMFMVIPRIAKWFFIRLEGEKTSHYIFVLSIVFLAAFMSQIAGLEPIIGAFIAGLALNRLVPQSSILMNRIQFIGNALFIPFFLISVGMLVDLRILVNGPKALWIAFVLSIVALIGKYAAARVTRLTFRFSRPQGLLIFGLSSSHAAATMAIILVGFRAGIIDENILNGTIILILVTCLVASFATEKAAKQIAVLEEFPGKEEGPVPDEKESILIPVANQNSLDNLIELTFLMRDQTSFHPIRVLSIVNQEGDREANISRTKASLENAIRSLALHDSLIETIVIADQNIPLGINRVSRELESTTLLLGWPMKETFSDRLFGQKTDHLIETSGKNIFINHLQKPLNTHDKIVLFCPPYSDLEQGFEYIVRKVFRLAGELNLSIHLYSNGKIREVINALTEKMQVRPQIRNFEFRDWDYFDLMLRKLSPDDFLILVTSRAGSVSHHSVMDHFIDRINSNCPDNSVIIVYPMVDMGDDKYDKYRDFSAEPITRSMEAFRSLQKGLEKMIHKAE